MNWAQENKTLAGIVGFMVVGGLGLGVWLYLSYSNYAAAVEEWETTQGKIATIRGKKLEPTDANVDLRQKQLTEYDEKVNDLRRALLTVQQAPTPISETAFQARMKERSTVMKKLASTLGMKALSDDFALGFDKYSSTPPRSPAIAAELNVHLDAIEKLVTTCIEGGVQEINLLERATKLADEDGPVAPKNAPSPTTKSKPKTTSRNKKQPKTVITAEAAAEPVLDRYVIKLLITTDQGPLQTIVNTLSHPGKTAPHFLVLRQLRIENTRQDGPTKEEIRSKMEGYTREIGTTETKAPEPPKPGDAQVIPPVKPLPRDAVDLLGGEMLKVYMEVDYIRFRPPLKIVDEEAGSTPAAAAPAKP